MLMNKVFRDSVINMRRKFLSPSLRTFEAYDKPFVITKGSMQYIWDENKDRKSVV